MNIGGGNKSNNYRKHRMTSYFPSLSPFSSLFLFYQLPIQSPPHPKILSISFAFFPHYFSQVYLLEDKPNSFHFCHSVDGWSLYK